MDGTVKPEARPELPPLHVEVRFGKGVPGDVQSRSMLAFEKFLRIECKTPAFVLKEEAPDDLKRRRDMTPEQRDNL